MSNTKLNIGLYVSNLVDVSVYSICRGASAAAKDIDANLIIFPGMHLNGDDNDPLRSPYYYQYNSVYEMGGGDNLDFLIIMSGIIGNTLSDSDTLKFIEQFPNVPVLTISSEYEKYHSIRFDNKTGLKKAINHLIHRHNCRNIAFVAGSRLNSDSEERLSAYIETLLENNLTINSNMYDFGDFSENSDSVVSGILEENEKIDAICFANDEMAKGGYRALKKNSRYIIGRNISVIGFDNSRTATDLYPLLTTVNADNYSMGYTAVTKVPELISASEPQHIVIPTNLVVRNSCGCKNTSYENLSYLFSETKLSRAQLNSFNEKDYMNYLFRDSAVLRYSKTFSDEKLREIIQSFERFFEIVLDYDGFIKHKHYRKAVQFAVQDIVDTGILSVMPSDEIYNIIDVIQYRMSSELETDDDLGLVFTQIYREFATYKHTSGRQAVKNVSVNDSIINYMVNDVIITGEANRQSLRPIMTRLHSLGIEQSRLYLFDVPCEHREGTRFVPPETIRLVFSQNGEDIRYYRNDKPVSTREIISRDRISGTSGYSNIISPLFSNEEIYGFIICSLKPEYYQYINKITIQIGTALKYNTILKNLHNLLDTEKENSRNLEKISKYDELTGVFNRRGYFDSAEAIIHNPANEGKNAIVVFADMDNLKTVNDKFGHDDGDFALKSIAKILSSSFRTTDVVGRIGGDEFAAFALPGKTDNINQILHRITDISEKFNRNCDKPYYVNMSVGIYQFTCSSEIVLSDILEKADEILYQQKHNKRKSVLKNPEE